MNIGYQIEQDGFGSQPVTFKGDLSALKKKSYDENSEMSFGVSKQISQQAMEVDLEANSNSGFSLGGA